MVISVRIPTVLLDFQVLRRLVSAELQVKAYCIRIKYLCHLYAVVNYSSLAYVQIGAAETVETVGTNP